MVTADAYNAFISSGRKNINAFRMAQPIGSTNTTSTTQNNAGVFLVAQDGGINSKLGEQRAPGLIYDYYLENVEIVQTIAQGKAFESDGGSTNMTNIKFDIVEPYGFSFISHLRIAAGAVAQASSLQNAGNSIIADKQVYILGIRFLGYDANGNILNGAENQYESYYDIHLNSISFKLEGKTTIYHCDANGVGIAAGYGVANGRVLTDTTTKGKTVEEVLNDLVANLNKAQLDYQNNDAIEIPNQYAITYVGPDASRIKNSTVVNLQQNSDKTLYPSQSTTSDKISTKDEIDSGGGPNGNQREFSFKGAGATSILDAIQNVIKQSSYVQDSMSTLYVAEVSSDNTTKQFDTANANTALPAKWINVTPETLILGYDRKRKDYAYQITYVIESYNAPVVNVSQVNVLPKYPGPVKRYDYWLTGKNSEITKFELQYNSLYSSLAIGNLNDQVNTLSPIPKIIGQKLDTQNQGQTGVGLHSQNSFINFLNDASAYANVTLTILGDPDWLASYQTSSLPQLYDRFYGPNGYDINVNSGQVFIEIVFQEAVDYDHSKGVMDVSDKLMFWDYPDQYKTGSNGVPQIQGMAFFATSVTHHFKRGKFEQTLALNADLFTDTPISTNTSDNTGRTTLPANIASAARTTLPADIASAARTAFAATDPRLTSNGNNAGFSQNNTDNGAFVGFRKVQRTSAVNTASSLVSTSNPPISQAAPTQNSAVQTTSPTGGKGNTPVQDGDAGGQTSSSVNTNVNIADAGRETSDNTSYNIA
jgi:hypothetical protein